MDPERTWTRQIRADGGGVAPGPPARTDAARAPGLWVKASLGLAILALLAVPFALRPEEAKLQGDRKLVIISPHWEGIRTEFARAFSEWTKQHYGHTTELEWLDMGGTSDVLRYVRSEFERTPEGINIDLFFGGGVDPYMGLIQDGLLAPCDLPKEILDAIPQSVAGMEIYDAEQRWFGACLAGFGILYNREVLRRLSLPQPKTWEDLGRPEYLTWVGSGDPRSSGSMHMMYEIIAQAYGWEAGWGVLTRMGANVRMFANAASQVPKDAATGDVACGMAIDVYAGRQIAQVGSDRMGFHLPEGLTVVNPDGIGMLKGAPSGSLAEKFIEFVVSEPGQRLWVCKVGVEGGPKKFELGRMSVIPGFAERLGEDAAVTADPYEWMGGFLYDSGKGGARWTVLNDLIGACIIDTHDELVAAWRAVNVLPADDSRVRDLVRPPLSEDELMNTVAEINELRESGGDAEFRAALRARWVQESIERYSRIARGD